MPSPSWFPWALRAAWATLPLTAGPGLGHALDPHSGAVRTTVSVVLWAGWAAVLLGTLAPFPIGLTALRVTAPLLVGLALWSASPLAVAAAGVAAFLAFAPPTGLLYANGPAYPNERRFPLRAPGPLLAGLLPLAWLLAVVPLGAGVLLLACERWPAGGALAVVGLPVTVVLVRSMHSLSRRWVVFVPAGLVLHDPLSLADPVLFERKTVESLRLAPADTDALDLTQRAPGLALELALRQKVPMTLVRPGIRAGESGSSALLMFTPTRPGAVLAEARTRGLGQTPPTHR
jgi:hypothetical protein